jgi:hypothetical protein
MHSGEPVCADPFAWLASGLTTNTGMFHLGQPGTGKSAFAKRQIVGMVAHGVRPVVLGDVKGEYAQLVGRLGGQVIRVGRGLDRLNPLDTRMLSDPAGADARGRQLNLLMALCASVRRDRPLSNGEQVILAAAVDEVVARSPQAVVPQVLAASAGADAGTVRGGAGPHARGLRRDEPAVALDPRTACAEGP